MNGKTFKDDLFDTGNEIRMSLSPVLFDIVLGFIANAVRQEKYKL